MTQIEEVLSALASGPASTLYVKADGSATLRDIQHIHSTRRQVVGLCLSHAINGDESTRYPSHSAGRLSDAARREFRLREQAWGDELSCLVWRHNVMLEQSGAFQIKSGSILDIAITEAVSLTTLPEERQ